MQPDPARLPGQPAPAQHDPPAWHPAHKKTAHVEIPAPAGEEAELPVLLTPEEIESIPPAIEEEEAIEA